MTTINIGSFEQQYEACYNYQFLGVGNEGECAEGEVRNDCIRPNDDWTTICYKDFFEKLHNNTIEIQMSDILDDGEGSAWFDFNDDFFEQEYEKLKTAGVNVVRKLQNEPDPRRYLEHPYHAEYQQERCDAALQRGERIYRG